MCGIVGYVGRAQCADLLMDGLRRLEYRGYDSAGLAVHDGGSVSVRRSVGKLNNLAKRLHEEPLPGTTGVGHTRWATHGRPNETNAHPHTSGDVTVVHNGIIENHATLRADLVSEGFTIQSETDTEIVAHLIERALRGGVDFRGAVRDALQHLKGAYAIAVLNRRDPSQLVVAKKSSPLVIARADGATLCASDIPALLDHTRDMMFLEDGDHAVITADRVEVYTEAGEPVQRPQMSVNWTPAMAEKAGYKHYMLKEIFEQPRAVEDTLRGRLDLEAADVHHDEVGLDPAVVKDIKRVCIVACGTSHHAGIVGRYFLEGIARIPTVVELASEFRARTPVIEPTDLVVAISQSGETLDTLEAVKLAKKANARVLTIANVIGSAIPRHSDATFYTHAGPEVGVASTKCFMTQVLNMLMFSLWLGRRRATLSDDEAKGIVDALVHLPQAIQHTLDLTEGAVLNIAKNHLQARDVLFLGRGPMFPIALEGALKLKEISYVHAEGYASGEMKHGPIALLDESVPVIVLCPSDRTYGKSMGNLHEAKAREAQVIAVCTRGDQQARDAAHAVLEVPKVPEWLLPFLTVIPLQLYAYHVADQKGTDVDQPRNLAKTVTVE